MGLRGYILQRTVYSFVLLFFVITLNFIIFQMMPGNPAQSFVNPLRFKPEQLEELEKVWGLRDPFHVKYAKYVSNLLTWQFGRSFLSGEHVANEMAWRMPYTLVLVGGSTIISLVIGILLGVIAAHKRGGIFDSLSVFASLMTNALPTFWMGMLFLLLFYSNLHLFPNAGAFPREWGLTGPPPPLFTFRIGDLTLAMPSPAEISARLWHIVLPLTVLTLFQFGSWLLLTRATMMETLTEDYVVTARAKGLKERTVLYKHALKNASLPLITSAALAFGFTLSGAIITETVFSWPGLGGWIWLAITVMDFPVMQAVFYVIALCVIVANFIADLLYGVMDPRIKYG